MSQNIDDNLILVLSRPQIESQMLFLSSIFHQSCGYQLKFAKITHLIEHKVIPDCMNQPFQASPPQTHQLMLQFDRGFFKNTSCRNVKILSNSPYLSSAAGNIMETDVSGLVVS